MKENTSKSVTEQLNILAVNDKVSFPYSRARYIKTACYMYGRSWGKTFSIDTTTDRNLIIVTRTA